MSNNNGSGSGSGSGIVVGGSGSNHNPHCNNNNNNNIANHSQLQNQHHPINNSINNPNNNNNNNSNNKSNRQNKEKRFSIHDAFEEETDEAIRIYGSTVISTPMRSKQRSHDISIRIQDPKGYNKYAEDSTSRDSDSLIQECGNLPDDETTTYCWRHPKIRENWRTVLAAITLLLVGTGLFVMGTIAVAHPVNLSQGIVFFVAGLICFIPGAYHVVYIWLAASGYRGFDFYHLPLFT